MIRLHAATLGLGHLRAKRLPPLPRRRRSGLPRRTRERTGGKCATAAVLVAHFPPVPSRVRPRIRPAAHTSSRHALRACSVLQHDCFFSPDRCYYDAHRDLFSTVAVAMRPPHHHGHVASPTQAPEFPARPAASARQRFAHIHRDSASLR